MPIFARSLPGLSKFARPFIEGGRYVIDALARFDAAVKHGTPEESYS
jgi:hypothetical protein